MTSRTYPVATVDNQSTDDEEALGLREFAAELEEIAKTLEDDTRRLKERAVQANQWRTENTAAQAGPSYRTPPPVSHNDSTEHRSRPKETSQRAPGATALDGDLASTPRFKGEDDDDVPTPMQTPAPLMFSPLFDSGYKNRTSSPYRSRTSSFRGRASNKVSWDDYLVSTCAEPEPLSSASRENRAMDATPVDKPLRDSSSTYVLDLMRNTIEKQDDRIRSLEVENSLLRSRIRDLEADLDRLNSQQLSKSSYNRPASALHVPSSLHPYELPSPSRTHRSLPSPATTYRTYLTPTQSYRPPPPARWPEPSSAQADFASTLRSGEAGASPGARFVADLSRLIDVDPIYHAPLSRIMDDHFARASSESKSPYEWGTY